MTEKKRESSFYELALALAKDYETIYVINSSDDSYIEYATTSGNEESQEDVLKIVSKGENFYADTIINCRRLVYPDDQEKFLKTFEKKRVMGALEKGKSFALNYRLVIDGEPQYYFLKSIRKNDEDIIIGVQNVDEQMRRELKDKEQYRIYSEIAKSLAGMFEAIYYIDINTGLYTEYYSSQSYSELGIDNGGEDFFEKVKRDIQVHIYEEDREILVRELDKDNIISKLEKSQEYSLVYRQFLDGRMQYLNLIAFKQENDDDHIVIGVRNIDEQKRQEEDSETYSHIAGALASRYEVIYYIDIDTNNYTQYSSSEQYAKLGTTKKGNDFFKDASEDIKKYIHNDDKARVLRILKKDHLLKIIAQEGVVTMNYRQQLGGESRYVSMMVVRPKNDEKHLVMGVTNIDAQVRREEAIKAESQAFDEIAMALAKRYEVIYQVNINNDDYIEYSSSEVYQKLDIGTKGTDFFKETQENMKRDIFPEDYPMMAVAMKKENLLKVLKETGKYLINYRLILDGRPQYVTLFAISPKEDSEHIIVAVANIDSARKMELEYEEALGTAMDMANHDPLTGLKNKRCYAQMEMRLDNEIAEGRITRFSIIVCDLNGLKIKNDSVGHSAGDVFIQEAAKMIGDSFKNSVVFRIGGDEFAVLLEGEDYRNRDRLVKEFAAMQVDHLEKGLVTVAFGMSNFRQKVDNRVQDVFERADKAMYEDKKNYKDTNRDDIYMSLADKKSLDELRKEYEKEVRFYKLYEELVSIMTDINNGRTPESKARIEKILIEISSMHRLSLAETRLYKNTQDELADRGEILRAYDTGQEGEEVLSYRTVSKIGSIALMRVYMSPDEIPLSEKEKNRVSLVMKTVITYVSRNRITDMVEELTYYDEGYKNLKSFQSYIMKNLKDLNDKAAFRYNLKHFSLVNQDLGRKTGDLVIRRHFDGLDSIIGDRGCLCRMGGDNFIGLCGKEQLGSVLAYLSETPVFYDVPEGKSLNISSSVGVYRIPEDAVIRHQGDIMEKVIVAFHAAQTGGNDRIVLYNKDLIKNKEGAMKVQQLFPEALRNEEFRVYYQPKVDIRTGEIIGAEALCRWFHEDAMISPGEFIPVLEETNDICKLDFYMLDHVCQDIRRWLDQGKKVVRTSVNLSRKHLINVNLLDNLLKIIDRHNIPHSCIEVELTETTTDVDFSDLKRVVTGLQSVGIFTSVDDFGVGYSSLNLIKELPWNVIKVDRSFLPVEGDEASEVNKVMFKHVISMTCEMGIECIVEGVETEDQLSILRENNCNYAQGFLYDRPLPKADFEDRMLSGFYEV